MIQPDFNDTEQTLDWLINRAELGASVSTAIHDEPAFDGSDVQDILTILNTAVRRLVQIRRE
jgi:hypothetical protein